MLRSPHRRFALLILVILTVVSTRSHAQDEQQSPKPTPVTATDLLRLQTVTSIDVAADARLAVYAVRSTAGDLEDPKTRSHLYAIDLTDADAQPRQLTHGSRSGSSPALSPNAQHVAFTRAGDEDDNPATQIWIMPLEGGEAWQLTNEENGAFQPRWSPDGKTILYTSALELRDIEGTPPWPMERPQRQWNDARADDMPEDVTPDPDGTREQVRAWLAQRAADRDTDVINRLDFQGEQTLKGPRYIGHLFTIDVEPGAEAVQRTSGFRSYNNAAFMPDGKSILYSCKATLEEHPDRVRRNVIRKFNIEDNTDEPFIDIPDWNIGSPRPSASGREVLFTGSKLDAMTAYRQTRIGVAELNRADNGTSTWDTTWITDPDNSDGRIEGSAYSVRWQPASGAVLYNTPRYGGVSLMSVTPASMRAQEEIHIVDGRPVGVQTFDAAGNTIVYAQTTIDQPSALRVRDVRGDRLLHDVNPWTAQRTLSYPTRFTVDRPDGTDVEGWLMEPTNRIDGKRYPLALEIHGGPSAMWGPGELSMWHEFQLLCAWGYGVVYCNPRGSGGYGFDFEKANYQDWGTGPAGDVLACVDYAALQDWVDEDRLVVTGGSYAGYLTAWIVAHDHRFKAAVAQRGVYDLATFHGEGNAWRLVPWEMGGHPWDPRVRQVLKRESPYTYVNRIRTPLMIMHASEDLRTGVSQSEMMFRAMKVLEKETEYVRYPGSGHDLSRSGPMKQRIDRLLRIIEFFERHISNDRTPPGSS